MTRKVLVGVVGETRSHWPLGRIAAIHHIGELWPDDGIVFVGVTSAYRSSAFEVEQFIVDYFGTRTPSWECEVTSKDGR